MSKHQKSDAWKTPMQFANSVYCATKSFPKEELYALPSQMKRAVVSTPANIAEGLGRQYKKDTIPFLHIARDSAYELDTLLNIAVMVEIPGKAKLQQLSLLLDDTVKLLNGLINYMQKAGLK